jgi:hypothetical protein
MIKKETPMSKTAMSAMDHIYADPTLLVSYRIGAIKTRLTALDTYSRPTEAQITEINCLDEMLTTLFLLRDLLTKGN